MVLSHILSEITENYDDRHWWRERIQERVISPVLRAIYSQRGIDLSSQDWDNLLILDACRSDMFESVVGTSEFDEYQTVRSQGSSSPNWISANFADRELGDVVYITANPWVAEEAPSSFHKIVDIWAEEQEEGGNLDTTELAQRDLATSSAATVTAQRLNTDIKRWLLSIRISVISSTISNPMRLV